MNDKGRNQTEEESKKFAERIQIMLDCNCIKYENLKATEGSSE